MRVSCIQGAIIGLALMASGTAGAAGMNLAWNDCPQGPTASTLRTFACDSNAGTNVLVVSFEAPPEATRTTGLDAVVDVYSESCPMSNWWQFKYAGTCRRDALAASAVPGAGQTGCGDPWQGAGSATVVAYLTNAQFPSLQPYHSRILVQVTTPDPQGIPVSSGTEYFGCNIVIANDRTVGDGACYGCSYGACLVLNSMDLLAPEGSTPSSFLILTPLTTITATWQGGVMGCGATDGGPYCTVPVQNRTWGQLKSIYR